MSEEGITISYDSAIDEKYRIYASISFAVLLLGLGVPLWWHTTTLPRVTLPYDGIEKLSDLEINVKTKLVVVTLSQDRSESLVRDITEAFQNASIHRIEVVHHVISSNLVASAFTHHELEKVASIFDVAVGQLLLLETSNLNDAVLVGTKRTIYFSTETSKQRIFLKICHIFLVITTLIFFSCLYFDSSIIGMAVTRKVVGFNEKRTYRTDIVQFRRGKQKEIPG
ncbi:hypothetical protein WN48_01408 [Eufriesea mexicana]|uniref:GPI transamidase component PIG-S n=1 Tax=Eufriesea mexicana TaxID=516756 RepID=A0A310SH76_9HYME|nr:hypothetical protein WN48_01408 [Eufriesea mexicana]